jgi:hypothetical protein
MAVVSDPGARRNHDDGGVWVINILTSMLVAVLSLYVFRAADTRAEARAALEIVEALPGQIAATPAMAAVRRRE